MIDAWQIACLFASGEPDAVFTIDTVLEAFLSYDMFLANFDRNLAKTMSHLNTLQPDSRN